MPDTGYGILPFDLETICLSESPLVSCHITYFMSQEVQFLRNVSYIPPTGQAKREVFLSVVNESFVR